MVSSGPNRIYAALESSHFLYGALKSSSTQDGGQHPDFSTYQGPDCSIPKSTTCGLCFKVENLGDIASPPLTTPIGTATVQIIDACPAGHAQNFCKTDLAANQRCQDPSTNSLDIDRDAYRQLTGFDYLDTAHVSFVFVFAEGNRVDELQNNNHPNLNIRITPTRC